MRKIKKTSLLVSVPIPCKGNLPFLDQVNQPEIQLLVPPLTTSFFKCYLLIYFLAALDLCAACEFSLAVG